MPLVPSVVTHHSGSLVVARKRALESFKEWLNAAPVIVEMYNLEVTTPQLRQRIRQEFEKHRFISDINTIDVLLFKSRLEYEETMNMWKQKSHVMRYFEQDTFKPKINNDFMSKFLSGR